MPSPRKPTPPRRATWLLPIWIIVGLFIVILSSGTLLAAAHLEENDAFCTSCHTQPETTFFARSQAATAVDLASNHHGQQTRCIDCHSGIGIAGRANAMEIGAVDLVAFVTKTSQQPAPLTHPIADANCLKCHADVLSERNFERHFHAFLPKWQARASDAATCVGCHSAHTTDGEANLRFLQRQRTTQVCQACHHALRHRG